ncbi:hypothetical protein [Agrobacterium tumefaciens]|uniref:hypothetical protein n=1 Tax=Agrobacterium tumefaciens TaxID=358 RepID=UPI00287DE89F|nr:hypothetical protein [Agrobacterium tumefaciens]MDS7594867.1 TonB-dependent receptor [Agrobacterium tumefaciens]
MCAGKIIIPDWDLALSWNSQFVARQDNMGYTRGPSSGYGLHGISLDWTPKEGTFAGTEVHASIDNMFDKFYMPYLSDGISAMPGRNFKLSISRKF